MREEAQKACDDAREAGLAEDVWEACSRGDMALLRSYFIVHGTAPLLEGKKSRCHHKDEWGRTLVHTAAWWGNTNILRFLLTLGADVNVHDTSVTRSTPLLEAARAGNRQVCEFLIRYGAKVKIADSHGDTAFHWAARRGHGTLIAVMLAKSEEFQGASSTRGVLEMDNNKLHIPLDVASNETVAGIIRREMARLAERDKAHKKTIGRIRGGLMRAKMVGFMDNPLEKSQAKKKRYGHGDAADVDDRKSSHHGKGPGHARKKKKKKKKHSKKGAVGEQGSLSSLSRSKESLPEVQAPKGRVRRSASDLAASKEANKKYADLGDGGVPDELVGFMALDDFHYGVREY